jgi:hypothetical protein
MENQVRNLRQAASDIQLPTILTPVYNALHSRYQPNPNLKTENDQRILRTTHGCTLSACLEALISTDGAGSWPPRASFDLTRWPIAIRPYHFIYHDMVASLTKTRDNSLDPLAVRKARLAFREHMSNLFSTQVDLPSVECILRSSDGAASIALEVRNAFSACIAMLRHSYRYVNLTNCDT